ncbi:small RNA 2'-O-methyltransferase-like [Argiope bruennichi]|uniref:small RNA 2'-O-methyltransferase-like n=1 Tax=Argiope bruennichi TaxID=94029 RepID=UPI0024944028|nr:small RNA 2'-O-methyltransferase-like [Argiope bruennichi]XP_055939271.1 small RNA 2'-O-methyltransferase-like [Argiope bruennichi]XP_055939272.1 small RNA 2'-O-methyltransferase-like [Argiope bruennichi]
MSENKKEEVLERSGPVFNPPVYIQRYTTVRDILFKLPGIEKVVDFGCAEGKFIKYLKKLPFATEISCVDLHEPSLESAVHASRPNAWDFIFKRHQPLKIKIFKGSALENDSRLQGYNAVTCIELIEHLEPKYLEPLTANIFGFIRPKIAIFTTPNCEFNVLFPNLEGFRHWDHKFEWDRKQFEEWCNSILDNFPDYTVKIQGVGDPPPESSHLGPLSQLAVFTLKTSPSKQPYTINSNSATETYNLIDEHLYPGRSQGDCDEVN